MFDTIRRYAAKFHSTSSQVKPAGSPARRTPNLFEAAAAYVVARAEDDQDGMDEASAWVSPEALSFGVNELACRAVVTLARERSMSPRAVARDLLGLPAV
ncbi:hypothetical protein ABZW47_22330 [Streptomyces sp. NPDC004549]|uniref:hypothetical protein n=1 Tax=Streptomyces sp. NPDC004549 TaxID=3154283 RepID=UPI0033A5B629